MFRSQRDVIICTGVVRKATNPPTEDDLSLLFPSSLLYSINTLPYRVRSVVMRAKVREFNVISFLICDS